ncbi:MAG: FG-GAP-like repeat-containing protein [Reichenbachiella sp.]|uniref:FG-GAP-like repeat-containing protein n=1 Tax=Reichenbachiella sp. TaxID=2184521 RepID=UPI003266A92A
MKNFVSLTLLALILATHTRTTAQPNPDQIVQATFQKLNTGKVEEAINDLNGVLETQPEHGGALSMLGLAYRRQKDYANSLSYYERAVKIRPENSNDRFNLGLAYALTENKDDAFKTLMAVKAEGTVNITNVGNNPAAAFLKDDPRYKQLFPTLEEYADPFVEEGAEIIHDWSGENENDQFGWIGRNIGDVDGDSIMDLTTSAPTSNEGAANAGKIYVFSGATGELIWSHAAKEAKGQLGMSIEAAGDVNGDGIPDVVAGAPYINKALVFSGADGQVIYEWSGKDSKGAFGIGVRGVGDVNQDGRADVLVSEPYQVWGGPFNSDKIEHAGKVYLYSGADGTVLQEWEGERIGDGFGAAIGGKTSDGQSLLIIGAPSAGASKGGKVYVYKGTKQSSFFTIDADETGSQLGGMFLSVVGDVNGDGIPDVYASDFANTALGRSTGRAYIHSGSDGSALLVLTGESAGDGFGIGVADAGDTNYDGFDDLVIGAWQHASAAPSGGKVYVYSGKDGSILRTLTGKVVGETLGFDTTGLGDINGDGKIDLLLTSAWSAINGTRSGRMFVVAGR